MKHKEEKMKNLKYINFEKAPDFLDRSIKSVTALMWVRQPIAKIKIF